MSYEYKVVPAPLRGLKAKGLKTSEDRFANALQSAMNEMAADGWEYLRADTLPCEKREGLMSKTTVYQNMLVFRRVKAATKTAAPAPKPTAEARPKVSEEPLVTKKIVPTAEPKPQTDKKPAPSPDVAAE
jgi:hypothetical protein